MTDYSSYEKGQFLLNGKYKYLSPIQAGSFGKVTLAVDVATGVKYAMKAMYKSDPGICKVARHEIKMLTRLGSGSPNICRLVEWFETEEFVILMLEYCANGDLYDLIHSTSQVPAVDIWHIAREMHSGLAYAHSLGIYHRDIKPENVLFTAHGQVKLCDWGLSTTRRISRDFRVGSEKYMAPECFGTREQVAQYDCQYADYWSFGITLLTAIFGTSPFKPMGSRNTVEADTNYKHFVAHQRPEVLFDVYPTMSQRCFDVVMHALKIGGVDDDMASYTSKIESRSLLELMASLQNQWKFGLTIDEEYDLEEMNHEDMVFDMDDVNERGEEKAGTSKDVVLSVSEVPGDCDLERDISRAASEPKQLPFPSLIESYPLSRSWCDFDEEDMAQMVKLTMKEKLATIDEGKKFGEIQIVDEVR